MSSNSSYRLPSGGGSRGRDRRGSGDGRIPEAQPVEINRYNLLAFMNRNNFMHSIQKMCFFSIHRALFPSERSSRVRPDGDSERYRREVARGRRGGIE